MGTTELEPLIAKASGKTVAMTAAEAGVQEPVKKKAGNQKLVQKGGQQKAVTAKRPARRPGSGPKSPSKSPSKRSGGARSPTATKKKLGRANARRPAARSTGRSEADLEQLAGLTETGLAPGQAAQGMETPELTEPTVQVGAVQGQLQAAQEEEEEEEQPPPPPPSQQQPPPLPEQQEQEQERDQAEGEQWERDQDEAKAQEVQQREEEQQHESLGPWPSDSDLCPVASPMRINSEIPPVTTPQGSGTMSIWHDQEVPVVGAGGEGLVVVHDGLFGDLIAMSKDLQTTAGEMAEKNRHDELGPAAATAAGLEAHVGGLFGDLIAMSNDLQNTAGEMQLQRFRV